jgi:hypothetical protein
MVDLACTLMLTISLLMATEPKMPHPLIINLIDRRPLQEMKVRALEMRRWRIGPINILCLGQ